MREQPRNDYLIIDNDSILWLTHEVSATTVEAASKRRVDLEFFMKTHTFSDIFVFQRYMINPDTGKMIIRTGDDLGPDYVLEPYRTERLLTLTQTRISRLVEIREGGKVISEARSPTGRSPRTRPEIEKARQAYLETFLKRLP